MRQLLKPMKMCEMNVDCSYNNLDLFPVEIFNNIHYFSLQTWQIWALLKLFTFLFVLHLFSNFSNRFFVLMGTFGVCIRTSKISLLALGDVTSLKTLIATGIFTSSPSGIHKPYEKNKCRSGTSRFIEQ